MSPVPMAEGFLSQELTCPMDTLIEPKRRMGVLHPKGNGILYLHCTYNSYATTYGMLNLMAVGRAVPCAPHLAPYRRFKLGAKYPG